MKRTLIALAAGIVLLGLTFAVSRDETAPKKEDAPKKEEQAKPSEPPKEQEASKPKEAPKQEGAPKKEESPQPNPGRLVYAKNRCFLCHAIQNRGNTKNPLDGIGSKLYADQIRKWIVSPKEMNPDTKMKAYDTLPKKEIDDLVDYLFSLK